jgi:hypothetical protein
MTLGYSKNDRFKTYSIEEIALCLRQSGLSGDHLSDESGRISSEGQLLIDYFAFRAAELEKNAKLSLMNREEARLEFEKLLLSFRPTVPLPFNKQKGEKRHHAYLTGIVNILTERQLGGLGFNPDPRQLVTVTRAEKPLRTLSRRVDGAYPDTVNPVAIWEIKEYYGTTTFGSRVAGGVYETLLDGFELQELMLAEGIDVRHYLIIDDYFTWWTCGKSYLCRMVDMVHQGFVDEVIFGRQVIKRWPQIVESWATTKS